ncbi:hypothetical protein MF1_10610 [Bartonella quintana]|nr:hypothetical protein MF1_10610 [Bartonella quintana]
MALCLIAENAWLENVEVDREFRKSLTMLLYKPKANNFDRSKKGVEVVPKRLRGTEKSLNFSIDCCWALQKCAKKSKNSLFGMLLAKCAKRCARFANKVSLSGSMTKIGECVIPCLFTDSVF